MLNIFLQRSSGRVRCFLHFVRTMEKIGMISYLFVRVLMFFKPLEFCVNESPRFLKPFSHLISNVWYNIKTKYNKLFNQAKLNPLLLFLIPTSKWGFLLRMLIVSCFLLISYLIRPFAHPYCFPFQCIFILNSPNFEKSASNIWLMPLIEGF